MNPNRFDRISSLFGERRLSRRAALVQGAGLAAGGAAMAGFSSAIAQDASPNATPEAVTLPPNNDKVFYLFVQSYQSGSIASAAGDQGTHTLTLEKGMGQTIYFSDRPAREVGTSPTPAFLEGLGFDMDDPPNAALVMETAHGETDIAVVELFNPTYDEVTHTATYDIAVLANWQESLEMEFQETPSDISALPADMGRVHLFIDDCRDRLVQCYHVNDFVASLGPQGFCYWWSTASCLPCTPKSAQQPWDTRAYWDKMCNDTLPACEGRCQSSYE